MSSPEMGSERVSGAAETWYISHETYARILDILARRGYGNEAEAVAAVRLEFGLHPLANYQIVIEAEEERRKRSLKEFFGRDPLAAPPEKEKP